jgi:hypothetical protein
MSCEAINNYLAYESSRLGPWFYQRGAFANSPELQMITREEYPREMGYDFRILTYERAAPTSILSWSTASAFSADGQSTDCGACANSFNAVDVGYTTRTATLYKHELKSRMVCVEDFKAAWEVKQQLDAIMDQLQNYVKLAWEQRAREDMFTFSKHKVVCDGTLYGNSTSSMAAAYPAACATDVLQQPVLDAWYSRLYRDGAAAGAVGPLVDAALPGELSAEAGAADDDRQRDAVGGMADAHFGEAGALALRWFHESADCG